MSRHLFCISCFLLFAFSYSCKAPQKVPQQPPSTSLPESIPLTSINWSTITPEEIWAIVAKEYQSKGPAQSLSILDSAVQFGAVSIVEAEQVRAGFLFELGRYDEAFLALSIYKLDANRPDLLRLRAEILWGMGRYDEAIRDYETVLSATEPSADLLFALNRLYDSTRAWDKKEKMKNLLESSFPSDPSTLKLHFLEALQSEEAAKIKKALDEQKSLHPESEQPDPIASLANAEIASLEGDKIKAAEICREYLKNHGFDINLAMELLRLDVELGDFQAFETDARLSLKLLQAEPWLDTPPGEWPPPVRQPQHTAKILDWLSALQLGYGNTSKAKLFAERALALDPYDYTAKQQLALTQIMQKDLKNGFETLKEAYSIAPPSDIKVRIRMLQLAPLLKNPSDLPWSNEKIASELDDILRHRSKTSPQSALILSAMADLSASRGNLNDALKLAENASSLPGAIRDFSLRKAYYLILMNREQEAWLIVQQNLAPGFPYLTWANALMQESLAQDNQALYNFAEKVRSFLDPDNLHSDFFSKNEN